MGVGGGTEGIKQQGKDILNLHLVLAVHSHSVSHVFVCKSLFTCTVMHKWLVSMCMQHNGKIRPMFILYYIMV